MPSLLPPELRAALLRPWVLLVLGLAILALGIVLTSVFYRRMDILDAISGGFVGLGAALIFEGVRRAWRRRQELQSRATRRRS